MHRILIVLLTVFSAVQCFASEDRAALYERANSGDAQAQADLAFSYSHWSSPRYNIDKSNYWNCLAASKENEQAIVNLESRLGENWKVDCLSIIKRGNKREYSKFLESGMSLGEIELSPKREMSYVVPSERFWRVEWPIQDCDRVCKSDLVVHGQIYVDDSKSIAIHGEFELNAQMREKSVIWLFPESKLRINISGSNVKVVEFVQ